MRVGGGLGIGGGLGAFMINASVSGSYGYDFRAAARVTTKLHAVFLQKDQKFLETMLARAREISAEELKTKDLALVDMKEVNEQLGKFAEEANVANVIKFIEANREPE